LNIAWGITGAGHFLKETIQAMNSLVDTYRLNVTIFISNAGLQVVRIYGFWDSLKKISDGSYLREIVTEAEDGPGFPRTGRFLRGIYSALIISPATMNSIAKMVHGVADTIVTNAMALAQKARVPILIVPTDQSGDIIETQLPQYVSRDICRSKMCKECPPMKVCPNSVVEFLEGEPRINLALCQGCKLCIKACPFGAIRDGDKIIIHPRKVDLKNVRKLKRMHGVTVLDHPMQICAQLLSIMKADSK